jgi:DNA-binding MarR family transcriptional regulator
MPGISLAGFADVINEIMPEIARGFVSRQSDELFRGKITVPQFFLLSYLQKQGELRMTDIARFLSVTTAASTGVVERLVKAGYALRVFDPRDRRIIRIKLSVKGSAVVEKIMRQRRQMIMDIFGEISENERQQYLAILTRIQQVMRKQNQAGFKNA